MASEVTKVCPQCGQTQTVRRNQETGEEFFGCSAWPECQHTEPLPTDAALRRQDAPMLPGF